MLKHELKAFFKIRRLRKAAELVIKEIAKFELEFDKDKFEGEILKLLTTLDILLVDERNLRKKYLSGEIHEIKM